MFTQGSIPVYVQGRCHLILDDDYPYMGIFGPCRSKGLPVAARINGYFNVYVGGDERELMRAVAKQPVEVTICATGRFVTSTVFPKIYVYHADRLLYNEFNLIPCHPARFVSHEGDRTLEPEDFAIREDTVYNHSVLLVGYGVDEDGPYWKIKNSWGPTWGNRGFAKLRRGVKDPNGTGGMTRPGAFVFFPVMD